MGPSSCGHKKEEEKKKKKEEEISSWPCWTHIRFFSF